jgi:hypothetical protein
MTRDTLKKDLIIYALRIIFSLWWNQEGEDRVDGIKKKIMQNSYGNSC